MHRAALLVALVALAGPSTAADALDALTAKDPITEATKAFADGDRRHILVPVCGKEPGEVIPGWPLHDSPRVQEAMKAAQRPISCADLGEDPNRQEFMRAARYVERYNDKLLQLEGTK